MTDVRLPRRSLKRLAPSFGILLAALFVVFAPAQLAGQDPARPAPTPEDLGLRPGRPRVSPTRTVVPPRIDGVLDDEVWSTAAHITRFTQQAPVEGAPATEETDVYIAYDSERLYFGFHAHYQDPSIMRANRVERDRASADDLITVYFDTFLDQQRGYDFDVNGYGVQGDGVMSGGIRSSGRGGGGGGGRGGGGGGGGGGSGGAIPPADRSWNALFDTGARIVEDGFIAEMAIPFKSLRYPTPGEGEPHRWGFQIVREVKGKNQENQVWAPMSRDEASFFAQMGLLEGMTDLSTSRNLEILPTVTAIQYGDIDPTRPGFVNQSTDPDLGVNIKYGITSNLTADLAINPDFSQIESDQPQIEVNLRDPIIFAELRPFFLEGVEIFSVPGPVTFLHTRTIVDPDYGAKLTGQLGRVSLGVITANDRAPGRVDDPSDPAFDRSAWTVMARGIYNLESESTIGTLFTNREFMDSHSRLFGVNANVLFTPTLSGVFQAAGTRHQASGQEESTGHFAALGFIRNGRNLSYTVVSNITSPEFETDVGFVRRTDQRFASGTVSYRFWPESWIINWGPSINHVREYDYDGIVVDNRFRLGATFSFARNVSLNGNFDRGRERWLGTDYRKTGFSVGTNVSADRRYNFGGDFTTGDQIFYAGPFLGHQVSWSVNGSVRPTDAFQTTIDFTSQRFTDPASGDAEIFDVKIIRAQTNYQFTSRLGVRNITEWNTQDETFDFNVLFNYRVNAGTVFYLGYDDHYQQADLIEGDMNGDGVEEQLFFTQGLRRTNRAIFAKFQYLLRY